jgi:hypothetical protein
MTRFSADAPGDRRALVAEAVFAHRARDSEAAAFEAGDRRLDYADRVVTVPVGRREKTGDADTPDDADDGDAEPRVQLDALLDDYPVFKVDQPATRKADDDVVYVSAIADPKHVADFVDDCFRRVYGRPNDYELWVTRV